MSHTFSRRGIRVLALGFLTLTAILGAGCGGDAGGGLTDPPSDPSDPGPSDPGPSGPGPTGPVPVGDVMYAVDLSNNFLVFGSGSIGTLSAKKRITGVPILKRIIGLAIRPSDGAVIGVGNDSRVYTIDPLTAEATPVSGSPFSPQITSFFDVHFAMALEPGGGRIRLVSAESGANWSIDIGNGTASEGSGARYGAGSDLEGETPRLLGLVYPTLPDSARRPGWCENLAYALDADRAIMLASCDPHSGWWYPTGMSPDSSEGAVQPAARRTASLTGAPDQMLRDLEDQLLRCGEFQSSPEGSSSDGEQEPPVEGGPWFPRSPDTEFYVFLNKVGQLQNRAGVVKLVDAKDWGINWIDEVPSDDLIQSGVWAVGGPYGPSPRVMAGTSAQGDLESFGVVRSGDPWASCAGR